MTFLHPDDVDITVVRKSGDALTLDVKTLVGREAWPIGQFAARKHHFFVFVHYSPSVDDPGEVPAVYVVDSESLKRSLLRKRTRRVSLDALSSYLNAWEPLTSEPAA